MYKIALLLGLVVCVIMGACGNSGQITDIEPEQNERDETAPVISQVLVSNITETSVTISWATNEPAKTKVEFGRTSTYDLSWEDSSATVSHSVDLADLEPATEYHFRVVSTDRAGTEAVSMDSTFSTLAITGPPLAETAWPMFHHDLQHTGRSPYEGPAYPQIEWRYATKFMTTFTPVIGADGTVYVGSLDDNLYALTSDGSLKWRYETGGHIDSSPAICADGTIYFGARDGYLYAINADGSLKWRFETGGNWLSSPALGADGAVYIGSADSNLYAVNPDGSLRWQYDTGGEVHSSPAIGADGTIFFGSNDKHLYAVNQDGSLSWRYETGSWVHSSPAIDSDGIIYVGSDDGCVYALNPDGSLKWRYETAEPDRISTPSIGTDGTIYVGSYNGYLYAINPDGSLKWNFETGGDIRSSPTLDVNGTIFFGSYDGHLYAVNPDGSLEWRFQVSGSAKSPVIGHDGTIFLCSTSQFVHAIGTTLIALVTSSSLSLREGPGSEYPPLAQVNRNDELAVIGQFGDCEWLKVVTGDQTTGWVRNQRNNLEFSGPCNNIPNGTFRPFTGYVGTKPSTSGHGELKVANGTSSDGVVILTSLDGEAVMSAYIRSGESFTLDDIQNGTYRIYFSMGSEWDGTLRRFTQDVECKRFEDILEFEGTYSRYTTYEITLHAVAGGMASTEYVDSDEFPDIGD